jgi:putative hydrolases of HD superfamily
MAKFIYKSLLHKSMSFTEFFKNALKLKEVKRTGWMYKDIPSPESVADHTWGISMLALTVPLPKGIDRDRLVKMALIHDLGEIEIGDVVWETGKYSNVKKRLNKHESEKKAFIQIMDNLGNDELKKLSLEFLEQKTQTALFLRELDKLEMVFQALAYEAKVHPSSLDEFWENANKYIKDKTLKEYFEKIKSERSV